MVVWEAAHELAGFLVSPQLLLDIAGVVEEASVEVVAIFDVRFVGHVDGTPGVRVGGVGAHGHVLPRLDERWVRKEGADNAREQEGPLGLVLEVAVPVGLEIWAELGDFGVRWPQLGAYVYAVPAEHRVNFFEGLDEVFASAEEAVKGVFGLEAGFVGVQEEVVVLVVFADARKVANDRDVEDFEYGRVADTGAFEYLWGSQCAGTDYDELVRFDSLDRGFAEGDKGLMVFVGLVFDTDGVWR